MITTDTLAVEHRVGPIEMLLVDRPLLCLLGGDHVQQRLTAPPTPDLSEQRPLDGQLLGAVNRDELLERCFHLVVEVDCGLACHTYTAADMYEYGLDSSQQCQAELVVGVEEERAEGPAAEGQADVASTGRCRQRGALMPTVHRLKVTLKGVRPPIWRRIEVRSDTTLDRLAAILEAAMGWEGYHLHGFEIGDASYQEPTPFDDFPFGRRPLDESKHRLGEVLALVGEKGRWDYDFGDSWEHDVMVEAVEPADPAGSYPRCVTGRRACPPEDCGGTWGYANLLEAVADPRHPQHAELTEWLPLGFDSEHFEAEEMTEAMQSPRPPLRELW